MRTVVIEDEVLAARNLLNILEEFPDIQVVAQLDSILPTVEWFRTHTPPDLLFLDIHLADGSAFKLFEMIDIPCPVIFTTAYDEYAVKAFKVNSIDYLLKPITADAVDAALKKLQRLTGNAGMKSGLKQLIASFTKEKNYRSHFLVPIKGSKLIPLPVQNIGYIIIDAGTVRAVTYEEKSFVLENTLDELTALLNPCDFFRANRQFIVAREAIRDVDFWFNSRLSLNLKVKTPERILISKMRVAEFREWFTKA